MAFGWADYLVCALMLVVSSSIGIYYRFTGGKQRTTQEFLLANNDANMWAVACSLMATFMSSITILGVSSEIYTFGTQFVVINLAYGIFTPVAAFLYLPVFFKLKTTSAYEYLERRFGVGTRLIASLAFSIQMVLYMGIVVYAPALALEAVTGIPHLWAVIIIGVVCTFYAGLGGMKAVLMTDVFQSILMFAAVFLIIITAIVSIGFYSVWDIAEKHERIEFWNFDPDPTVRHTWWTLIIGGGFTFLSLYAVNQAQVQRYLSCKNLKQAQKSLFINWPILSALSFSTCFAGLCIFSKYYNCDPVLTERISSVDQLMPRYVLDTVGGIPGLSGLFVAGIFSGSLSTVSSALNSLSAVTIEDYIKPAVKRVRGKGLEDSTAAVCSKVLCIVYGGCCLAIAFVAKYLGAVLQAALTIFGVVGGPVLGTFTLGMFFPVANEVVYGALPERTNIFSETSTQRMIYGNGLATHYGIGEGKARCPGEGKMGGPSDLADHATLTDKRGSLAGLLISLCFGFWFGFGGPKPPLPILPRWSTKEACAKYDDIPVTNFINSTTPSYPESDYLYIYRVSYQWYIVLSFLISVSAGLVFSWIGKKLGHVPGPIHPSLFIPPVAKYLERKRNHVESETESQSSDITLRGASPVSTNGIKTIT